MKGRMGIGVLGALLVCAALADQIAIPHQFSPGTPARSAEVNANFQVLTAASNDQDQRIAALETLTRTAPNQMICAGTAVYLGSFVCVRSTSPDVNEELTYPQIVAEGWVVVSISGVASQELMVLNRYDDN